MIASLLGIRAVRRHALIADPVPTDTAARRPIVTVTLLAIALGQRRGPVMGPAIGAAAGALALGRQRTAWLGIVFKTGYFAPVAVFIWAMADVRRATAALALATTA